MSGAVRKGFPIVGVLFLALAVFEAWQGDGWVVWAILGVLFGGLGIFGWTDRSNG